ncbi:alpha/beta fold hydrolase [Puniceicoccales bacterium CK1056]|uniref:Alpha/beta fold hydrolase n=1 Tax=Oceanipulchritudo coccoides TaxID=2706888 RepID=A0A6B2M2E3_9BACT|nr:alpha/beta fold hydrolase [Oceanipulchritudo coccoides]NDV61890.1 alpha/beta fold hydrolase [Oceanipulchritudo coccoides]
MRARLIEVLVAGSQATLTFHPAAKEGSPTLIALHGFTGSGEDFLPLRSSLGADSFNWVCVDFMGHGRSQSPDSLDPYLLVNALSLIDAARSFAPDPHQVCLLGYSMGARVGLHYLKWATPMPAVLIAANPGIDNAEERSKRRQRDGLLISGPDASINDFCDQWEAQDLIRPQTQLPEPIKSELAARRRQNDPIGLRNTLLALGSGVLPSLWADLAKLPPALCLFGQEDDKFQQIARSMQREHSGLEAIAVPGSGHAPHLEAPEATAAVLSNFLLSR